MPCDTRLKPKQTISQRAQEIREIVARTVVLMAKGKVKAIVDRATGAVAFTGLTASERDGITDACMYRRIMAGQSQLAKATIARAETLAGRKVDGRAVALGVHSHDGGNTWHNGH